MRYVIFVFLITLTSISYSQYFVGDSRENTKSALKNTNIKFTEGRVTDTTDRISWVIENEYQMILVLNTNDIVTQQTLIPEKPNGVNELVKWFNKDCVVVSDTEWRNYANGKIYKIELKYISQESIFSITLAR